MAHSLVKTKQFIIKTRSDADSSVFQDAETITITKLGFNMAGFKKKLFNVATGTRYKFSKWSQLPKRLII